MAERLAGGHERQTLFEELDLSVGPGDVVGVVGANGARKSTLLRFLSEALEALAGSVDSVPAAVAELREMRGPSTVLDGPEFASVGEHDGMLIIVSAGRTWFPTDCLMRRPRHAASRSTPPGAPYEIPYRTVLT